MSQSKKISNLKASPLQLKRFDTHLPKNSMLLSSAVLTPVTPSPVVDLISVSDDDESGSRPFTRSFRAQHEMFSSFHRVVSSEEKMHLSDGESCHGGHSPDANAALSKTVLGDRIVPPSPDDGNNNNNNSVGNARIRPRSFHLSPSKTKTKEWSRDQLSSHIHALRIEVVQSELRVILMKLMSSPLNKGIFNSKVDAAALGLHDYFDIVKEPMDLGTVKWRLQAMSYGHISEFEHDIRLTFQNSMQYNPPVHYIHEAARSLLSQFESEQAALLLKMQQTQTNRTRTQYCELCHTCHLQLEPCLIICHGTCNQKIKRGADYFVASDSSRVFCKKCYSNLNSLLPDQFHVDKENTNYTNNQKNQKKKRKIYYKRDLLKRKYEEEIPENWVSCTKCHKRMHHICALHNRFLMKDEDYVCPMCHCEAHVQVPNIFQKNHPNPFRTPTTQTPPHPHHPHHPHTHSRYTYKSGQAAPDPITTSVPFHTSNDLPTCALSRFIEGKIRLRMRELGFGGGPEKSISIRVVSETTCSYQVPEVIRRHYELYQNDTISGRTYAVPEKIRYTSKAILMFQTIDYVDVCLFCMYVHEYDTPHVPGDKRIYIAYLDSVDHFRPKPCRTPVYQEILVAYLAYARADGFVQAHIWSCPPLKGNNFIFWTHPNYQKTPNQERLTHWYEQVLARAIETGTVTAVKSLYDAIFKQNPQLDPSRPSVCPPIMEGDFWIDETQRVHHASLKRHLKNGSKKKSAAAEVDDRSTAVQIGNFLKNKVMEHPSAIPFNRPVNTVALKLFDYFDVIKRPMDLGTVQVRCLLGEFDTLLDVICDVKLVFDNARRYNPPGHIVHTMAVELEAFFIAGLQELLQEWKAKCGLTHTTLHTVQDFHSINLRLGQSIADQLQILVSPFTDHSPPSPTVAKIPLSPPPVTKRPAETLPLIRTNVVPSVRTATPSPTAAAPLRPPSALSRTPRPPLTTKPSRKVTGKRKVPRKTVTKLNLMHDGAAAVAQHMLGEEIFITSHKKKAKLDLPVAKLYSSLKRGSWLGEEVGAAVRKMRSNFFLCDLRPKGEPRMEEEEAKLGSFQEYVGDLERERRYYKPRCGVMDMRQNFLELSQHHHYQFDTLRRAKYSSVMLLHHLLNPTNSSLVCKCTTCAKPIGEVWWHDTKNPNDNICLDCYEEIPSARKDNFTPHRNYSLQFKFENGDV